MSAEGAATKRPYLAMDIDLNAGSSALEGATRGTPKQKTTANPAAARKSTTTKRVTATKVPTVDELYNDSIKKLENDLRILDGRVRSMGFASRKVTTDTYAKMSLRHLEPVKELEKVDGGLVPAFNLMLYVADASHTDSDITGNMSGYCDSGAPFGFLDNQLLELIDKRHAQSPATRQGDLPNLPEQWKRPDPDVWKYETLNLQEDVQIQRQKLELEQERRVIRNERRVAIDDWVAVALQDLEGERDYLTEYGVTKYFPKSIDRLTELMGSGSSTAAAVAVADGFAA